MKVQVARDIPYIAGIAEKVAKTIDSPQEVERDFRGFVMLSTQKLPTVNSGELLIAMISVASVVDAYLQGLHPEPEARLVIAPKMGFAIEQMVRGSADAYPVLHRLFKKGGAR